MDNLNHVLIIPDGNRRFAKEKNIAHAIVYNLADSTTTNIIHFFLIKKNIKELSFFGISRRNVLNRKNEDLQSIFDAQMNIYKGWIENTDFEEAGIRFNFFGDLDLLPLPYKKVVDALEKVSMNRTGNVCNLLIAYDGQWDILRALEQSKQLCIASPNDFYNFLEIKTPIDLVIRTGKERRLSGCPLFQTSYSEFIFTDYHYPELNLEKLEEIANEFNNRQRRFGK